MAAAAPCAHSPIALMSREMTLRPGPVPQDLGGRPVLPGQHRLEGDSYVLRASHVAFHYRRGEGLVVERTGAGPDDAEELLLHGSVYAAVASLNGFMPLHASAIAAGGAVVAFTGPSGAGKSTLVAGLARLGFPLFCDDTLVLDIAGPGPVRCLPGHKRMKLWLDAAELVGAPPQGLVSADYPKYYVTATGGDVAEILSLAGLVFLEEGAAQQLVPVTGGEKIARFDDDHYTRALFDQATRHTAAERFALHARIAAQVRMARFVRPLRREDFDDSLRFLAARLLDMVAP